MKCFYHDDMDGRCAAAVVRLFARGGKKSGLLPIRYRDKFPLYTIEPGETVWIVDFSISVEEMKALLEVTPEVVWIDHHKTAIEKYNPHHDILAAVRGVRRVEEAGCLLTWVYTCGMSFPLDYTRIPWAVRYVSDYDVWTFEHGDETRHFRAGMELEDTDPHRMIWDDLLTGPAIGKQGTVGRIIGRGTIIEKYKKRMWEGFRESWGFETELHGHTCFAMGLGPCGSPAFGDLIDEYDICTSFVFDGDKYTVSLYSVKVDVSKIAKAHGGGGHEGAAGFVCGVLPFPDKKGFFYARLHKDD